ncbi:monoacylglycerol/Diacylglycerol O-acyltransferase-like isoform X2 [Rhineura floridana]|uniref:monoacylglycerol/Diacylglycerol O-acyltransferase-like isoform X2 n=1 Tax=Rhineura floridana TaxID=261503 RepID=UPI002AC7E889|nr:monoacylglycerol/Diacylglycerol O-acyltransferase-like isoform X2 [Rhineura floridana]
MIATTTPGALDQETMSWFAQILKNWIPFPFLGKYLSCGVHPLWLFVPLVLLYSFYLGAYFSGCVTSLLFYIYKNKDKKAEDFNSKLWEKPRQVVALLVDTVGKIWHGYEVIGMEHLPEGPVLIVYYHGATVFDYAFLVAKLFKEMGRMCYSVVDHKMYQLPGLKLCLDVLYCKNYNKAECVEILKKGGLLGISPGGNREGNFSDDYSIMWNNRKGFAQVALEARVPIIPIFTQNLREGYRTIGKTRLGRWLYEKTRLVILPIYGGFPVKFRTYIGEPIPYDPTITAMELAERTKAAIENLRNRYQKRPGNILRALSERFDKHYKAN